MAEVCSICYHLCPRILTLHWTQYPSIDFLTLGYVASSVGPGNAFRLFNIYTQRPDCRLIGIHFYPGDNSYRVRMPNGQPGAALCYKPNPRGAVVQQTMWQPAQRGDVLRHVDDAGLLPPVFFVCPDFVVGLPMSQVLDAPPGSLLNIFNSAGPAPLGGLANTHFCLRVSGTPTHINFSALSDNEQQHAVARVP